MDTKTMLKQLDSAIHQLGLLRKIISQGEVILPPTIATEAANEICHKCKLPLDGEKPVRGCHRRCHQEMNRAINEGEVTEAALMEAGRLGPASSPGRKKKTQFRELLAGARDDATQKSDAAQKRGAQKRSRKNGSN